LRGPMNKVVDRVCSLANLYCAFEDGVLVIKDTQTFTVSIPPIGGQTDILPQLAIGLGAIIGTTPITDSATRTIIYEATNRTSKLAESYFQRIRASTALIVYEIYIWEVSLNSANSTGIDWRSAAEFGKYTFGFDISGETTLTDVTPVSIGLPTTGNVSFGPNNVFQFISQYGAVKTVSQPQLTVLSGSQASLRAADTQNYVSSLTRSVDQGEVSVSTETDSVDTGFTLTIASGWDNATVYGTIAINLEEFKRFQNFDADGTTLRLPETTQRELSTQIRIRPGDSLLIAGLVRENDQYDTTGPGFKAPLIPASRGAQLANTELVFLLKPRVIVYTSETAESRAAEAAAVAPSPRIREPLFPTGTLSPDMLDPAIQ
jgi:type II secretory pathway component GspD/PulD (secretin)